MDVLKKMIEGDTEFKLRNGYEYVRIEDYEGQAPGLILGVYRVDEFSGWNVIVHDYQGRALVPVYVSSTTFSAALSQFDLVPKMRKFLVRVRRTVVEDALVEVDATDDDDAMENAAEVAENYHHDLDWEEYNTEYEAQEVKREL